MIKKLLMWLILIVAIVIIAIVVFINPIVKFSVEKIGPKITQTAVVLDDVDISLFSGKVKLKGFSVDNPEGFSKEKAFMFKEVNVNIAMKSLCPFFSDRIIIQDVLIDSPEITYQKKANVGSNIDALVKNVESFVGKKEEAEAEKPQKKGKKLQIDHFLMKNTKIKMVSGLTGDKPLVFPMPNIELNNIGADEDGSSAAEAIGEVLASFTAKIGTAVTGAIKNIPGIIKGATTETGSKLKEGFSKIFGGSKEETEEVELEEE